MLADQLRLFGFGRFRHEAAFAVDVALQLQLAAGEHAAAVAAVAVLMSLAFLKTADKAFLEAFIRMLVLL